MQTELQKANERIAAMEEHLSRQRTNMGVIGPAHHLHDAGLALLAETEALLKMLQKHRDWIVRNGWAERPALSP